MIQRLITRDYHFRDKDEAREFFTRLTGLYKNLNYAASDTDDYRKLVGQIEELESNYHVETAEA